MLITADDDKIRRNKLYTQSNYVRCLSLGLLGMFYTVIIVFTCKNYNFDIILQYSDIKRVSFSIFEIRLLG